ncbi:hypothetical protein JOC37_001305 [Desulfohalotomaculum tongense]|uniref:hypothetical protein n=1 Tax=Desulforadius tongensis TaxID=1216062 RepID=UPI001959E16B|nr:hypothetical protein [Desulforadius tongensis]MBM7854925.1 hypothetical protein [Desulforadius tongensis]
MPDKRLVIRLPDTHPLWQYPKGARSRRAREAIDAAMQLAGILAEIKGYISDINTRLDRLEKMIANGNPRPVKENRDKDIQFDIDAFLEI